LRGYGSLHLNSIVSRWRSGYGVGLSITAIAGLTPGRVAIKSPKLTQPSITPG